MIKYVLFDLDGTLTDPSPGITSSVAYALEKMGITPPADLHELNSFIGPPLVDSFMKYYGFTPEQAWRGVELYRETFAVKGIFENELFPGVPEMLAALKARGVTVCMASSKPELYVLQILDHFGLSPYFDFVSANDMAETRSDKAMLIARVREKYPDLSGENGVMVGDRAYDIRGGKANGLYTLGIRLGFAAPGELEAAGADAIAADVADMQRILLSL